MNIFIARSGQTLGPYDLQMVNALLLTGQLLPGDLAWSEGASGWAPLSTFGGVQLPAPNPNQTLPFPVPGTQNPRQFPPAPGGYPTGVQGGGVQGGYPSGGGGSGSFVVNPFAGDTGVEQVIFDTSASPLAVSGAELVLGLCCTGGLWTVYAVAVNLTTRYKLTTQRLTTRSGLISQRAEEIEVYRVRDVTMEQSTMGRMLGFGNVIVHASDASSPRLVLRNVSSPERIKGQIRTAARQGRRTEGVRSMEFMP